MAMKRVDTIVVGAGQAGLAMSFHLRQRGREHLVLERARVAERWRSERWDSLRFQSPNWSIVLPGASLAAADPDGFASKDDVARFIEDYGARIGAPVMTSTAVSQLRRNGAADGFRLRTDAGLLCARNVVVATGPYQRPRRASWHRALPGAIAQVHASEYRNPQSLPAGAVLVIGSGASGCQIADELLAAGRRVFLSVGRHARVPRRYRGRDIFWWRLAMGDLDRTARETPPALRSPGPLLTGADAGYEIDLRRSARRGLILTGRTTGVADGTLVLADDLEMNLQSGDRYRRDVLARIDAFAARVGLGVGSPQRERAGRPAAPMRGPDRLDLAAQRIGAVIWATGYGFDFGWIDLPVFDAAGTPIHQGGASPARGLYFLGLPWLHSAKSSFLCGVGEDAARIAAMIDGSGTARRAHRVQPGAELATAARAAPRPASAPMAPARA